MRGEADRSSTIVPPRGLLDVVTVTTVKPDAGDWTILGHAGPYAIARDAAIEILLNKDASGGARSGGGRCGISQGGLGGGFAFRDTDGCGSAWLQAAVGDLTVVCSSGPGDIATLFAIDANGHQAWTVVPRDAFADALSPLDESEWTWTCDGAAKVDIPQAAGVAPIERLVVPFTATKTGLEGARHRIAYLDGATGGILWHTTVAMGAAALQQVPSTEGASPSFLPSSIAVAHDPVGQPIGILTTGLVVCPHPPSPSTLPSPVPPLPTAGDSPCRAPGGTNQGVRTAYLGALAWLTMEGTTNGFEATLPREDPRLEAQHKVVLRPMVSAAGSAQGAIFAAQVGGRVLFIDPMRSSPDDSVQLPGIGSDAAIATWPAPLWQEGRLAVPTDRQIWFLNPVSHGVDPEPFNTPQNTRIVDLAGDGLGRLFVLAATMSNATSGSFAGKGAIVIILGPDGTELHAVPLPLAQTRIVADPAMSGTDGTAQLRWLQPPQFMWADGRLAVVDAAGGLFTLGEHPSADLVIGAALSPEFPPTDADVTLVVAPKNPATVERLRIRWEGGGSSSDEMWPVGATNVSSVHFYNSAGLKDVLVTLVFDDGTTATTGLTINVGGSPPPVLNPVQRAFSNENANTTWGLIGIALALMGSVFGLFQASRSRRRVRKVLVELARIRAKGQSDPLAAMGDLQELRRDVHDRALRGVYDQGQLHIVETKAAATARLLMQLAVAPFRDRMTPMYQSMLAGFVDDGRITAHEAQAATDALSGQRGLRPGERDVIRRICDLLEGAADPPSPV